MKNVHTVSSLSQLKTVLNKIRSQRVSGRDPVTIGTKKATRLTWWLFPMLVNGTPVI